MSQLIVGLFASAEAAAQVAQELISIGVDVGQIATIAHTATEQAAEVGAGATTDAGALVAAALREGGMSEAQAHAHAEAVRGGAVALLVTPDSVAAANIKAVMLTHGSIDIDSSGAQPNTLGQAPHLEPEAASPGLGLSDPGAVGLPADTDRR